MMRLTLTALAVVALGRAALADDSLTVFDWAGYEDPGFFQSYIDKHGKPPEFAFYGDDDDAFQKLTTGFDADLAHPCSQMLQKYRDADLIIPWDVSRLPDFANMDPVFLSSPIVQDKGGVWYIPAEWGSSAMAWNTEQVPETDTASVQIFLDPKYKGRISLPDNADDVWALALLATGVTDWTHLSEDQYVAARDWMAKAHKNVRAYWADGAELSQLMASGEVVLAWSWNESVTTLQAEGHPVRFQRAAKEGSSSWFCGYVKLKNGKGSDDLAYDFMAAWMESRTADYILNAWGYGHSNAKAMAAVDPALLDGLGLSPVKAPILAQLPMDTAQRDRMLQDFETIKSGF